MRPRHKPDSPNVEAHGNDTRYEARLISSCRLLLFTLVIAVRWTIFSHLPASALPTGNDSQQSTLPYNHFSAYGNYPALAPIHPMTIWFAHCFVPGPGYGLLCPVLSSRARACRRDHRTPGAPLPDVGVAFVRETLPPAETLLSGHRSYEPMCQFRVALLSFGSSPRARNLCRLLLAPAAIRTFSTLFCESFLGCLVPCPGGPIECMCL